ncbi:MAG TPA: NAD(P)-dependent oxidoreductase [Actinomycetota bacterium]
MARLALVTGATGFMAQHLIPDLVEEGWEVRASGRRARPGWLPPEVAYEAADLAAERALEALCDGADAVFHLAGATSSLSSTEEMHESNVVATTNLVAAARSTGVGRFVHMGSTSVYGEEVPLPQPVVESVEPHPSRGYGKAKWGAEEAVWAAVAEGLPAVVLRPVSVFGPGAVKLLASAILDVAIESFAGRRAIDVEASPVELRLVHVADVVGAAMHLADAEGAEGQAYNVVAPWYPTSVELAGMLAALFAMPVEEADGSHPGLALEQRRQAWEAMLASGMEKAILFTEERFRFLKKANRNNRLSIDALLGTGYEFLYGNEPDLITGVAETIDWYRQQRWIV